MSGDRTPGRREDGGFGALITRRAVAGRALARRVLRALRQVVGAPDYEVYLEHHARHHAGSEPLDRRAYYSEFVSRRFGPGPTRCC
jgi:uncharacterized short protein YbdD (DUF466 family)